MSLDFVKKHVKLIIAFVIIVAIIITVIIILTTSSSTPSSKCLNNCTSPVNGKCDTTTSICKCNDYYYGDDCSKKHCEVPCSNGGICLDDGTCQCVAGWGGENCIISNVKTINGSLDKSSGQCFDTPCILTTIQIKSPSTIININGNASGVYVGNINDCFIRVSLLDSSKNILSYIDTVISDGKISGLPVNYNNKPFSPIYNATVQLNNIHNVSTIIISAQAAKPTQFLSSYIAVNSMNYTIQYNDSNTTSCPMDCNSPQGKCIESTLKCECTGLFYGDACNKKHCSPECSTNGVCSDNGVCICESGWSGPTCSKQECPDMCSDHGVCNSDYKCICNPGYVNDNCSLYTGITNVWELDTNQALPVSTTTYKNDTISVTPTQQLTLRKTTLSFSPTQSASFALKCLSGSSNSGGVYYIGICPVTQPPDSNYLGVGRACFHCNAYITYNMGNSEVNFQDSMMSKWCNDPTTATAPLTCNYDGKNITFSSIYGMGSQPIVGPLPAGQMYTFCFGIYNDTTVTQLPTINPISLQIVRCEINN